MAELKKYLEKAKQFFIKLLQKLHLIKQQNPYVKKAVEFCEKALSACKKQWKKFVSLPVGTRVGVVSVLVIVALSVTASLVWHYNKKQIVKAWKKMDQSVTLNKENKILFDATPMKKGVLNDTITFGHMDVLLNSVKPGSFQSFEQDERGRRITKDYLGVGLHIFNFSSEVTEKLLVGLKDDKGGTYRVDESIPFYIGDLREFGRNMYMYPRIIQEGYLFFSNLNPEAKSFTLLIAIEATKEVIAFDFEKPVQP